LVLLSPGLCCLGLALHRLLFFNGLSSSLQLFLPSLPPSFVRPTCRVGTVKDYCWFSTVGILHLFASIGIQYKHLFFPYFPFFFLTYTFSCLRSLQQDVIRQTKLRVYIQTSVGSFFYINRRITNDISIFCDCRNITCDAFRKSNCDSTTISC
jgi:hypothetical protein